MAELIAPDDFLSILDRLGAAWRLAYPVLGLASGAAVAGTVRGTLSELRDNVLALDVYEQEVDLLFAANQVMVASPAETTMAYLTNMISALSGHISQRGSTVDATIIDFDTYLAFYNASTSKFTTLVDPDFAALYYALLAVHLASTGVMSPSIHPYFDAITYADGMGRRAVGSSFVDGVAVDTTYFSEVVPLIEVITNFSGGVAPPTVTITGTDDEGSSCTYGPITLAGNNPTAALASITITPVITAASRQVVAFSSTTGIVQGSVLKIDANTPSEEVIVVELVAGTDVTAVFKKAHAASATVTGFNTTLAGACSTGAGRRLRDVTTLAIGITSHAAGAVRIVGRQDRAGV